MNTAYPAARAEVIARMEEVDEVHVRLALTRTQSGDLVVRSLLIDVLPQTWLDDKESPVWLWLPIPVRNEYPYAVLFSGFVDSREAQQWLIEGEHRLTKFDHRLGYSTRVLRFIMPTLVQEPSSAPYNSFGDDGFIPMTWPHTAHHFNITAPSMYSQEDMRALVADDADYFPDFPTARNELMYSPNTPTSAYQRTDNIAVRIVRHKAWLNSIHIGQERLTVIVQGEVPESARLQLNGVSPRPDPIMISLAGRYTFPLPPTLPNRLTIAITHKNEELDRAIYDQRYPSGTSPQIIVEKGQSEPDPLVKQLFPAEQDSGKLASDPIASQSVL